MQKCKDCGKWFRNQRGLSGHRKNCPCKKCKIKTGEIDMDLEKRKQQAIDEMPLREAEKKQVDDGHYLWHIHFNEVPEKEKVKERWLKQELRNYFAYRGIGHRNWKEGDDEHPLFNDEEFEDILLLFQLPYLY